MILTGTAAILIYLLTSSLLALRLARRLRGPLAENKHLLVGIGLLAVALHGVLVFEAIISPPGVDTSFFSILSLIGWLVALLLLLAALRKPVENLAIVILPITALSVMLRLASDQHNYLGSQTPFGLELHILISIFAYSLLSIAVVQAILLSVQESHLHNRHPGGFIRLLPPLETMETMLFQMIGVGFFVLSLSLMSGIAFVQDMFAQHLAHKTVLAIAAWMLFGVLLWGRWRFGWRGRTAIRWSLGGFLTLALAYFGSKVVLEMVLGRVWFSG